MVPAAILSDMSLRNILNPDSEDEGIASPSLRELADEAGHFIHDVDPDNQDSTGEEGDILAKLGCKENSIVVMHFSTHANARYHFH